MNAFRKKSDDDKRSVIFHFRVSVREKDQIFRSAEVRAMSAGEFVRRVMLGKRADVRYELEAVLAIRELVKEFRLVHGAMERQGLTPPEDEMSLLIRESIAAIHRITR